MVTVTIIYKNGRSVEIECERLAVRRSATGELTKLEWTSARPRPLHVGVDEIAAVYEGKA